MDVESLYIKKIILKILKFIDWDFIYKNFFLKN